MCSVRVGLAAAPVVTGDGQIRGETPCADSDRLHLSRLCAGCSLCPCFLLATTRRNMPSYCPPFTHEQTEAQRGETTYPGSQHGRDRGRIGIQIHAMPKCCGHSVELAAPLLSTNCILGAVKVSDWKCMVLRLREKQSDGGGPHMHGCHSELGVGNVDCS